MVFDAFIVLNQAAVLRQFFPAADAVFKNKDRFAETIIHFMHQGTQADSVLCPAPFIVLNVRILNSALAGNRSRRQLLIKVLCLDCLALIVAESEVVNCVGQNFIVAFFKIGHPAVLGQISDHIFRIFAVCKDTGMEIIQIIVAAQCKVDIIRAAGLRIGGSGGNHTTDLGVWSNFPQNLDRFAVGKEDVVVNLIEELGRIDAFGYPLSIGEDQPH